MELKQMAGTIWTFVLYIEFLKKWLHLSNLTHWYFQINFDWVKEPVGLQQSSKNRFRLNLTQVKLKHFEFINQKAGFQV